MITREHTHVVPFSTISRIALANARKFEIQKLPYEEGFSPRSNKVLIFTTQMAATVEAEVCQIFFGSNEF